MILIILGGGLSVGVVASLLFFKRKFNMQCFNKLTYRYIIKQLLLMTHLNFEVKNYNLFLTSH